MTADHPQSRREDCRRAVLAHLAARPLVAQAAPTISRALAREHAFPDAEVEAAAAFLAQLGHLAAEPDPMGATRYYRITAQGTLAHERQA